MSSPHDEPSFDPGDRRERTACVFGATGFVGRHVVQELISRGWRVNCHVRDAAKAAKVLPQEHRTLVVGDIFDEQSPAKAVEGCDAVINCVGIRRETGPESTFERMHPRATEIMIDAAERAGVGRFVLISALGVRPDASSAYGRSKYIAESLLRRTALDWTILRPSIVHGPDGELMQMMKAWATGRAAPHLFMPYFGRVEQREPEVADDGTIRKRFGPPVLVSAQVQPVAVEEVAWAASLETDSAIGEVYTLTGPETLDWPELMKLVRDNVPMADAKKAVLGIPGQVGRAMAVAAKPLGLSALLPFGPSEPIMAMEDNTGDSRKAREQLGFAPGPVRSAIAGYASRI
jgi:NADH dehydrogenase